MNSRAKLLVSVRSVVEAEAAVLGGADLIDIKEPAAGPLGKADSRVIAEILSVVDRRCPVSAAFGEWKDHPTNTIIDPKLKFVKWGLAGKRGQLAEATTEIVGTVGPRAVLVHYADSHLADSPTLAELHNLLEKVSVPLVLIDTFVKDGRGLIDWISRKDLEKLIEMLRKRGTQIAVAGSLNFTLIPAIVAMQPDWIAVRGAACVGGRNGSVSEERVAELARLIRENPGS
ncbi:(5-formylfuran-3-yl)methyl phosphate synthase [Zavarzinella formosa]|uniref:(5-formylfuran-3-yl)methyl phosphate synthase n=1 Tax=Zavarzinella formosa TaxID=360055 RepID=UPI0002FE5B64|nr:(5-formylfuran-3-yl)methyl phosphate synthase [Zavarzinella formosa]